MAYRLLKDGQMVHVHRTTKIMPNGKPSHLTRGEVGRAGKVYEDLPEHVVDQILAGEFGDGVWEQVEPNPDFDPDADEPVDPWRTVSGVDDPGPEDGLSVEGVLAERAEKAEARADEAERELEVLRVRVAKLEATTSDDLADGSEDDPVVEHGHELVDDHEHEPITEALTNRRLEELVEMHGLSVVGTGSQGAVKKDDMLGVLLSEHGQA